MGQQACSNCSVCGDDAVPRNGSRDYAASPPPKAPYKQNSRESPRAKDAVHFKEEAPKETSLFIDKLAAQGTEAAPPELVTEDANGNGKARTSWQEAAEDLAKGVIAEVDAVANQCEKMQDAVNDTYEEAVKSAINAVEDLTGSAFLQKLEQVVDDTLNFMAPQCGEQATQKMWEHCPKLQKADDSVGSVDIKEKATESAKNVILSLRDEIIAFCQDILDRMEDGTDIVTACFKTLRKVLVMLLKALRRGVNAAINCIKKMVPGCCVGGFKKIIQEVYDYLKDVIQSFVKGELKQRGCPDEVVEKVDWDLVQDNAKIGQPKSKDKKFQKHKKAKEKDGTWGAAEKVIEPRISCNADYER